MMSLFERGTRRQERAKACAGRSVRKRCGASVLALAIAAAIALVSWKGALADTPRTHVYLLRGWFGVFSTGLDSVADELKSKGIDAVVEGHLSWSNSVAEIVRDRAAGKTGPLVLIGHSQGANNVIDMARSLETHKITVDLLITLTPFLQNPIPANVVHAINFYQAPGWGAPLEGDKGFHGKITNVDLASDLTITHVSIDKSSKVQAQILREIEALPQQTAERKK
jgi:hypothetical protein